MVTKKTCVIWPALAFWIDAFANKNKSVKSRIDHWLANFQNLSTSWCVVPNLFHKDSKQSQTVAPLHGQLDVAYVVISHVEQQLQSLIVYIYIYIMFISIARTLFRGHKYDQICFSNFWFFKSIRISVAAQVGKRLIVINFGLQKYEVGRWYCLVHFLLLIPLQIANDAIIRKKNNQKSEILPPHEFLMGTALWGSKPSNLGGFGRVWDLLFYCRS